MLRRKGWSDLSPQVTLRTESGRVTRMDHVGRPPPYDEVGLVDFKGSPTAPVRKSQRETYLEIEKSGATVVGKGKPAFPGGTVIPPTKVRIIYPWGDAE